MIIEIPDYTINEGILYLKNAIDILYAYEKIENYDVICEVSVINSIIQRMQGNSK